jgi:hypothetical protein
LPENAVWHLFIFAKIRISRKAALCEQSAENGEKQRKPEKISGFLLGIFFVKTH